MDIYEVISLFAVMAALAIIPSSSVALVVVRSAMLDVRNGIAASAGIVAGDLIFVFMAIVGLTALSEQMGAFFVLIRYMAATYLIWFGISLIRSSGTQNAFICRKARGGLVTGFVSGLLLTLSDVKAIFFYASLFPAFVDISTVSQTDLFLIAAVTVTAVGGIKISYAFGATKIIAVSRKIKFEKEAKLASGGLMIGAGGYLIAKT